jgi:antitoxin (DNA-binding transcriptional repressor) of toxin-antitoxin stability system
MYNVLTIYEAKSNLSKYIKRAQAGETFMIGSYGQASVSLSPIVRPSTKKRKLGGYKGQILYNSYTFDDIDPEIQAMFYGSTPTKKAKL